MGTMHEIMRYLTGHQFNQWVHDNEAMLDQIRHICNVGRAIGESSFLRGSTPKKIILEESMIRRQSSRTGSLGSGGKDQEWHSECAHRLPDWAVFLCPVSSFGAVRLQDDGGDDGGNYDEDYDC